MGDAEGAELVADRVREAERDVVHADDRHPAGDLAVERGLVVGGVGDRARQVGGEQVEGAGREPGGVGVGVVRVGGLDRVVERAHPRLRPEVARGRGGELGVEEDDLGRHLQVGGQVLGVAGVVDRAGEAVPLGRRERGRDREDRQRLALQRAGADRARVFELEREARQVRGRLDAFDDAERGELRRVDRGPAAERDDRVGPGLAGAADHLDHPLDRVVGLDLGVDVDQPRAERLAQLRQGRRRAERPPGDKDHPLVPGRLQLAASSARDPGPWTTRRTRGMSNAFNSIAALLSFALSTQSLAADDDARRLAVPGVRR